MLCGFALIRRLNQAMWPAKTAYNRGRWHVLRAQAGYGSLRNWGLPSPGLARPRKHDSLGPTGSEESGEEESASEKVAGKRFKVRARC